MTEIGANVVYFFHNNPSRQTISGPVPRVKSGGVETPTLHTTLQRRKAPADPRLAKVAFEP